MSSVRRVLAVVGAVLALVVASADSDARPKRKAKRALTYDEAIALLQTPDRWCDGSAALQKLGDRRAIAPLYRVVAEPGQGLPGVPDRACVRAALEKLGVREEALILVASAEPAARRSGIGMLKEFPADGDAAILGKVALQDTEPTLRMLAARALRTHQTSAAWDTAMVALLDAPDPPVRILAAGSLERRFGAPILAALRKRLAVEDEPAVTTALEAAIKIHAAQR